MLTKNPNTPQSWKVYTRGSLKSDKYRNCHNNGAISHHVRLYWTKIGHKTYLNNIPNMSQPPKAHTLQLCSYVISQHNEPMDNTLTTCRAKITQHDSLPWALSNSNLTIVYDTFFFLFAHFFYTLLFTCFLYKVLWGSSLRTKVELCLLKPRFSRRTHFFFKSGWCPCL